MFEPLFYLLFLFESLLGWSKFEEAAAQILVDAKHGSIVVEFVAVVGCAKYRYKALLCKELEPILHHLVPPDHQI